MDPKNKMLDYYDDNYHEVNELVDFLLDDGFEGEVSIEDLETYED